MSPPGDERQAREEIDRLLTAAGWSICDANRVNLSASRGVAPDQIRKIIQTYRDKLSTEIFPGREWVPKTLIFAKDDAHTENIVEIVREEFGKGNDFAQKITYRTTGRKPKDLINEFRTSPMPRIAVTVDMIATGTDIKAVEVVMFMRAVKSRAFFEQMKGRGVRVIQPDDLQSVTPMRKTKERFVVIGSGWHLANRSPMSIWTILDLKDVGSAESVPVHLRRDGLLGRCTQPLMIRTHPSIHRTRILVVQKHNKNRQQ